MTSESIPYTAFSVGGREQYEWVRMLYQLAEAPQTFQTAMNKLKERFTHRIIDQKLPWSWIDKV